MPTIRLGEIALARSGDKGSGANVGVLARSAENYELLRQVLTADAVEQFFKPMGVGTVTRFELPNLGAFNFLLPKILDGGGSRTLRVDAQGKTLGMALLELMIDVPDHLAPAAPFSPSSDRKAQ